jgi:hypothetical protein
MSHLPRASLATIAAAVVLAVTVSCQSAQQPGAASSPSPSPDTAQGGPSAAEWKELGKTFMFEGHPVFYVDQGSGMVTLAIHGYPTSSLPPTCSGSAIPPNPPTSTTPSPGMPTWWLPSASISD